ncbi:hypothetical protein QNM97_19930 [Gordonia sp. L191]|uniref:hypothetical protein n=1 Tax=Gordonia TaxID=2053 RepID=UPI001AD619F0|nr:MULTISPECIES: hypothetical protein [Gordonia]QTI70204.1 hypothetical protein J6U32_06430 [Gordonia polyisoprenivorans]WHU46247.1 hypothetical protein QNM97_19930 [Gordonia sp. L191]
MTFAAFKAWIGSLPSCELSTCTATLTATILAEEVGIEAAAEQLCHTTPETTRKHYRQRPKVAGDVRHVLDRLAPVS